MKASPFKDYSELPLFLSAETVAKVVTDAPSSQAAKTPMLRKYFSIVLRSD